MLYVDPVSQHRLDLEERGVPGGVKERKALEEYERLFLFQMLREMRKSVLTPELPGGESQREFFEEMLDDVWAGQMAKSGQLGIADLIASQLRVQDSQARMASERRAARAAGEFQGLPLAPPPLKGLPLHPETPKGLAVRRVGREYLELPRKGQGLPLRPRDALSSANPLPIKGLSGPAATRPGATGWKP